MSNRGVNPVSGFKYQLVGKKIPIDICAVYLNEREMKIVACRIDGNKGWPEFSVDTSCDRIVVPKSSEQRIEMTVKSTRILTIADSSYHQVVPKNLFEQRNQLDLSCLRLKNFEYRTITFEDVEKRLPKKMIVVAAMLGSNELRELFTALCCLFALGGVYVPSHVITSASLRDLLPSKDPFSVVENSVMASVSHHPEVIRRINEIVSSAFLGHPLPKPFFHRNAFADRLHYRSIKNKERMDYVMERLKHRYLDFFRARFRITSRRSRYALAIVEPRNHPHLEFVVKNVSYFFPNWSLYIFHSPANERAVREMLRNQANRANLIRLNQNNLTIAEYSRLLTGEWFYRQIPSEMVLVFQTDSYARHGDIDRFLCYDYVGAPWKKKYHGKVGNGGFSLRRIQTMLEAIRRFPYDGKLPEDVYFSQSLQKIRAKIPNTTVASQFSRDCVGAFYFDDPLGIHRMGMLNNDDDVLLTLRVRVTLSPILLLKSPIIFLRGKDAEVTIGIAEAVRSWSRFNPKYSVIYVGEKERDALVYRESLISRRAYEGMTRAEKDRLWSFATLHRRGGIVSDSRFVCMDSLKPYLLDENIFYWCSNTNGTTCYDLLISLRPGNETVVRYLSAQKERRRNESTLFPRPPTFVKRIPNEPEWKRYLTSAGFDEGTECIFAGPIPLLLTDYPYRRREEKLNFSRS